MQISNLYKAQKGLIKIKAEIEGNAIKYIQITGDFFMYPEEAILTLEQKLIGIRLDTADITRAISDFYATGIVTPYLTQEDFINAIMGAKSAS